MNGSTAGVLYLSFFFHTAICKDSLVFYCIIVCVCVCCFCEVHYSVVLHNYGPQEMPDSIHAKHQLEMRRIQ